MHDPRHLAVNGGPLPLSARQTRPAVTICPSLPRALYRISDPASRRPSPDALRGLPVLVVGREYERRRPSAALILIFGSARILILILILIFGRQHGQCTERVLLAPGSCRGGRARGGPESARRARARVRAPPDASLLGGVATVNVRTQEATEVLALCLYHKQFSARLRWEACREGKG